MRLPSQPRFRNLILLAVLLAASACGGSPTPPTGPITAEDLSQRIEAGNPPLILDVRTPEEFTEGHIPGALNIPHDELADRLAEVPAAPSEEVVVHCRSGRRAAIAEELLRGAGFTNIRPLEGHWLGWAKAGGPVE